MASLAYSYILSIFRNSHSLSLERLDVEQVYLLLHTLEKRELRMLKKELESNVYQLVSTEDRDYFIDAIESMVQVRKQRSLRNETVGELLKLFCNKNSKRVREARLKLKAHFEHRSQAVRRKIIDAFLDGVKSDRQWAYEQLMLEWSKCFEGKIEALWNAYHEEFCRCIIVAYFSEEYLLQHEDVWKSRAVDDRCEEVDACSNCEYIMQQEQVGEDRVLYADFKAYKNICMRLANTPGFVVDRSRLFTGDYYEVMARTGGKVDGAEMLDYIFGLVKRQLDDPNAIFISSYLGRNYDFSRVRKDYSVSTVCDLNHLLNYMALLKLDKELICFFNWDRSVCKKFNWRVDGHRLRDRTVRDIYVKVLKESLPESPVELCDAMQEYEENCIPTASALSPEEKNAKLETMCQKNPYLAAMIERLKME